MEQTPCLILEALPIVWVPWGFIEIQATVTQRLVDAVGNVHIPFPSPTPITLLPSQPITYNGKKCSPGPVTNNHTFATTVAITVQIPSSMLAHFAVCEWPWNPVTTALLFHHCLLYAYYETHGGRNSLPYSASSGSKLVHTVFSSSRRPPELSLRLVETVFCGASF